MLYTGKGDDGTTTLFGVGQKKRLSKSDFVFEALGSLDSLNSFLGLLKVKSGLDLAPKIGDIQEKLFIIQASIGGAENQKLPEKVVDEMEETIKQIESQLPKITTFLVAGGTELSALLDIARAKARQTERVIIILKEEGDHQINPVILRYLNRLSSFLYALSRYDNHISGVEESAPKYK